MVIRNDASLRGKCKAIAKKHGIMAQEVMQMYLFERFLARLEKSEYVDKFILKGGLLISSLIGVENRTTMDMDATLQAISLDEESVSRMISDICSIRCDDGVSFAFESVETIREDDDYGGLRAHIRSRFGRMDTPMKIDLTTGDAITPGVIEYPFPMMFDEGLLRVMSYPLATCVAEKYEALVKRGSLTTRARDLYDIYRFVELYGDSLDWGSVSEAIGKTAEHRGSIELMGDFSRVCNEMLASTAIQDMWVKYVRENSFAVSISLEETLNAIRVVGEHYVLSFA